MRRLAYLFRQRQLEAELADEMEFHRGMKRQELESQGIRSTAAVRCALGNVTLAREESRAVWIWPWLESVWQDGVYAVRQMRRAPAVTAIAVLSLALGIGGNTAILSLMQSAMWKAVAVPNPEQLRLFSWESGPRRVMDGINGNMNQTAAGGSTSTSFSYAVFLGLQQQIPAFQSVFAFKPVRRLTALIDGVAEVLDGQLVSGNFYEGLGIVPSIGRPIVAADDVRGAVETVAVISDGMWTRRFGRDPSIVGKQIVVNQVPVTIVGVNPPSFSGLATEQRPDIFLPLSRQPAFLVRPGTGPAWMDDPRIWWLLVMGRLKPDVTESSAQPSLQAFFEQAVRASLPERTDRDIPRLSMLNGSRGLDELREAYAKPLVVLFSLVGLVLLMGCANVANLLLARTAARQREISLRVAIGAGRGRVIRQLLTEGLVLAFLGGTVGLLLGYWLRDSVPMLLAAPWSPTPFQSAFDGRVLTMSIVLILMTGLLFSVAPAWRSARADISAALQDAGRATLRLRGWWPGKPLIVIQVCISVVLLTGAGLFIRTLVNLRSETLGFRPDRILLFTLDLSRTNGQKRKAVYEQVEQQIGVIPGVEAVTLSADPLVGQSSSITPVGPTQEQPGELSAWRGAVSSEERAQLQDRAWVNDVGHRFSETMGIPILSGRSFGPQDREGGVRVAVVSQQFARRFFPNDNPVGKTFRNGNRLLQIIGVAGDTRFDRVRTPFPPTFYRAYLQEDGSSLGPMHFEVRTMQGPASVVPAIREVVRSIDRNLPLLDVRTQTQQIEATLSQERLFVTLTTAFGIVALLLASIGIYGVVANAVTRRKTEIGIRLALGAQRGSVVRLILRETLVLAGVGTIGGILAAAALTRSVRAMLYGIVPLDPLAIAAAVAVMLSIAVLAAWIPARGASRLDPIVALRHE